MEIIRGKEFNASTSWGSKEIANMDGITSKIHWTDEPYKWHVNDGQEVFVVLDGEVEMFYRKSGVEYSSTFKVRDIFYASIGMEHVAHPKGEARVLVIESEGSV